MLVAILIARESFGRANSKIRKLEQLPLFFLLYCLLNTILQSERRCPRLLCTSRGIHPCLAGGKARKQQPRSSGSGDGAGAWTMLHFWTPDCFSSSLVLQLFGKAFVDLLVARIVLGAHRDVRSR